MLLEVELAVLIVAEVRLLEGPRCIVELHGTHLLAGLPVDVGLQDAVLVVLELRTRLLAICVVLYKRCLDAVLAVLAGESLASAAIVMAGALYLTALVVLCVLAVQPPVCVTRL